MDWKVIVSIDNVLIVELITNQKWIMNHFLEHTVTKIKGTLQVEVFQWDIDKWILERTA